MKLKLLSILLLAAVLALNGCSATRKTKSAVAEYEVRVTDEDGRPVSNAVVQICDGGSCRNYKTGAAGTVVLPGSKYEYEIHLQSVPDAYQLPEDYYLMPVGGGTIEFVLKESE